MKSNLNPLYEFNTPLIGKTGSSLRKLSSRTKALIKSKTGSTKSKYHVEKLFGQPEFTRSSKAKKLKEIRSDKNPLFKKSKAKLNSYNNYVKDTNFLYKK
jgi:cell shape-determining protein MreC